MTDLQPVVYKDFTAGLWERGNDRECPPNGLLECTNCLPLPTGGLRAGPTLLPIAQLSFGSGTGISTAAGTVPIGLAKLSGIAGGGNIFAVVANIDFYASGQHRIQILRHDESTAALSTGAWTRVFETSVVTAFDYGVIPVNYRTTAIGHRGYAGLSVSPTTFCGLVRFDSSTSAYAFSNRPIRHVHPHQARLVYVTDDGFGALGRIEYTSNREDGAATTNQRIEPLAELATPIDWLVTQQPSDILAMKSEYCSFSMQGDIAAGPLVRELAYQHNRSRLLPVQTDEGVAFHVQDEGIFLHPPGGLPIHLSQAIQGDPFEPDGFTGPDWNTVSLPILFGALGVGSHFLYAGRYMYDFRTRAWFKLDGDFNYGPVPGGTPGIWAQDAANRRMYLANFGRTLPTHASYSTPTVMWWTPFAEENWVRSNTFDITLPVIDLAQRYAEIRRVEIFGYGFGTGGTYTVTTENSTGQTTSNNGTITDGADNARINLGAKGDWVKVSIHSQGNQEGATLYEAPMIERVVIYMQPRQQRP